MTKYNELIISASKNIKRVGRGIAAGQGKTAGRGTKGQKARTGKKLGATFQGGSRSLVTAVPKARGFKSRRTPAQVVYLDHLNAFAGKTADNFTLFEAGYIATPFHAVKVILRGELTEKITLNVAGASTSVKAAVVAAGGTFTKTAVPLKMSTKETDEAK
ncbi:50S ribosomal protein L15 [Candidatus Saccharibacteria bacterium HGW-Saccharibacteria-1]|jgi:large subunit ribosomal protein L15|nr:ribosomal protein L15 [uncultured bacterium]PKL31484.1 MAG: 50S ribosomal protein L15 [Candidatus Saccharibacteria bacterium HGW-Saccharibacteria-1]